MKQEIRKDIASILDQSISKFCKLNLNNNDFYYRSIDSKINLDFGVFGEKSLPCIGLGIRDKFVEYKKENKYKIISLMNSPTSYGQRVIILLTDINKLKIFKKLYKWMYQDLHEDINVIKTFEELCSYIDGYAGLFEKKSKNISKESLLGLYGELDLLNELLKSKRYEEKEIVDSWSGYCRSTHDFNFPNLKLEVKSSLNGNNIINCSSYNQLITQNDFQTYLINLSYIENSMDGNGKSIFDIIESVKLNLKSCKESLKKFERKLDIFGIDKIYSSPKYSRILDKIYDIRDDFPSFNKLKIHSAISDIKYKIDLSMCEQWLLPLRVNEL